MFWNPEVITTTGKSLRITQIQFNIICIMRTNINQGRIQSLAVMIVLLINNDQNPISYLIPYSRLNLVISLLGDSPNIREYSRLKWDKLS